MAEGITIRLKKQTSKFFFFFFFFLFFFFSFLSVFYKIFMLY